MNESSRPPRRLLRRSEAAKYLREKYNIPCESSSLRTTACKGTGPVFRKCGRYPLYDEADLDTFALAKMSPKVRSTSELTVLRAASAPAHVST
jgi:hypothetical protein